MNIEGKIAYLAVTQKGKKLCQRIKENLGTGEIYVSCKLAEEGTRSIEGTLKEQVGELMRECDYLIFVMATGIVVRCIAPYIQSKFEDPGIVVLDEEGQNAISLLSGHMGGANEMTEYISQCIGAHPVITTATDVGGKAALDQIAKRLDAYIEDFREAVKDINYRLVHSQRIGLYIDGDYQVDTRGFIVIDKVQDEKQLDALVCITHKESIEEMPNYCIKVIPRDLVLGMGCKKGTQPQHMIDSFNDYMHRHNIDQHAIKAVGSIDIKKDEKAMQALAEYLGVPFHIVSKEDILKVEERFHKSEFVKKNVGVYSVAEPVAYLMSNNELILERETYEGITFALGMIKK